MCRLPHFALFRVVSGQSSLCAAALLLLCALPAAAQDSRRDPFAAEPRAARKVLVAAEGVPLSDLCGQLSKTAGVPLAAERDLADEKLILLGPARPVKEILADVAAFLNAQWVRRNARGGGVEHVLTQGVAAKQLEARFARAPMEQVMAALDAQVRALPETPEQLAARPPRDPVRRALADTQGMRLATQMYALLGPAQREELFARKRLKVPFAAFTAPQQAVLRKLYDERIEQQKQRNEEFMRENPNARLHVSSQAELEQYGVRYELDRQGGRVSPSVSIGNGEHLPLAVPNAGLQHLPPRGNPYTGEAVPPDAVLPPVADLSIATGAGALPDRLRVLSERTGSPIVADYYRGKPFFDYGARPAPQSSGDAASALDLLCHQPGYLWWPRGKTLLFRKRDWSTQRLYEVPDRWMLAMIERLKAQNGVPTHADVMRVSELTVPQLTGLLNLVRHHIVDEKWEYGLHELFALLRATDRNWNTPVYVGDLTHNVDGRLEAQASQVFRSFTPQQAALFARLEAQQVFGIPENAKGGEFKVKFFLKNREPQETESRYRYLDAQVHWGLTKQVTPTLGHGYGKREGIFLPVFLPDDRRSRTKVELAP